MCKYNFVRNVYYIKYARVCLRNINNLLVHFNGYKMVKTPYFYRWSIQIWVSKSESLHETRKLRLILGFKGVHVLLQFFFFSIIGSSIHLYSLFFLNFFTQRRNLI